MINHKGVKSNSSSQYFCHWSRGRDNQMLGYNQIFSFCKISFQFKFYPKIDNFNTISRKELDKDSLHACVTHSVSEF